MSREQLLEPELTDEQTAQYTAQINGFDQYEMCRQWRFSKPGTYPWFDTQSPLWPIWEKRFKELGGFTPAISKSLGWGD